MLPRDSIVPRGSREFKTLAVRIGRTVDREITCTSIGMYDGALTRGRKYAILAEDPDKRQVKILGDNGRARWFPMGYFDLEGGQAPILVKWRFDDEVQDEMNDWVDVSFELSDGELRWCTLVTPRRLIQYFEQSDAGPGLHCSNLVVVPDLTAARVERVLHHLDDHGELIGASLPLE